MSMEFLGMLKILVGICKISSDKTSISLNSSSIVSYPFPIELKNVSEGYQQKVVDKGLTLAGFSYRWQVMTIELSNGQCQEQRIARRP